VRRICALLAVAERLAHVEPLRRPKELGTADENTTVRVTARVALDFELDGVVLSDEFMVVPNLRREVIIGAKTMQAWRIKADMRGLAAKCGSCLMRWRGFAGLLMKRASSARVRKSFFIAA